MDVKGYDCYTDYYYSHVLMTIQACHRGVRPRKPAKFPILKIAHGICSNSLITFELSRTLTSLCQQTNKRTEQPCLVHTDVRWKHTHKSTQTHTHTHMHRYTQQKTEDTRQIVNTCAHYKTSTHIHASKPTVKGGAARLGTAARAHSCANATPTSWNNRTPPNSTFHTNQPTFVGGAARLGTAARAHSCTDATPTSWNNGTHQTQPSTQTNPLLLAAQRVLEQLLVRTHAQHVQRLRTVCHQGGTGGVDLGLKGALIDLCACVCVYVCVCVCVYVICETSG